MNIYSNDILIKEGKSTFFTKVMVAKLIVLMLIFSVYVRPRPAEGGIILGIILSVVTLGVYAIVDHNNCWANLIWGCDDGGGGGGNGGSGDGTGGTDGSGGTVTYTYESDFPPASDGNGLVPSGGTGGGTRESIDSKPCTQGTTCPGDELGEVVVEKSIAVSPAYADSKTNTCPLLWTPGKSNVQSTISCKYTSAGNTTDIPTPAKDPVTGKNKFSIAVGKGVLSCSRTTTETVTQYGTKAGETEKVKIKEQTNTFVTVEEHNVRCNAIPNVNEI